VFCWRWFAAPRSSEPPNDWPMCRRSGRGGLVMGAEAAVGTIGLLGTLGIEEELDVVRHEGYGGSSST